MNSINIVRKDVIMLSGKFCFVLVVLYNSPYSSITISLLNVNYWLLVKFFDYSINHHFLYAVLSQINF